MRKHIGLIITIIFYNINSLHAQTRIYVNEYLNIGVGAHALAMGGAKTASTDDVYSTYYNPAGLTYIKDKIQVGLMHAEYFSGNAKYDYASVAVPTKDQKRCISFAALRFATDDIPYTIDYVQPDGSFDESKLKSISAGDFAFYLSYAQKVKFFKDTNFHTSIGANAKMIYRNIGSMANAFGAGVDLGVNSSYKKWIFGVVAKDVTTTYTSWAFSLTEHEKEIFGKTGNEIPVKSNEIMLPRFNFGVAYQILNFKNQIHVLTEVNADLTTDGKRNTLIKSNNISIDPRIGLQADYKKTIFLRAGIANIQKALDDKDTLNKKYITFFQPSVGIGLKLGMLVVDYAYTSLQTQRNSLMSHIVSLRLDINPKNKNSNQASIIENSNQ